MLNKCWHTSHLLDPAQSWKSLFTHFRDSSVLIWVTRYNCILMNNSIVGKRAKNKNSDWQHQSGPLFGNRSKYGVRCLTSRDKTLLLLWRHWRMNALKFWFLSLPKKKGKGQKKKKKISRFLYTILSGSGAKNEKPLPGVITFLQIGLWFPNTTLGWTIFRILFFLLSRRV